MGDLTENFSKAEMSCKCGCGFDIPDTSFINRLQTARSISGVPYKITSGCRCNYHNKAEGGTDDSDHITGEGVDIETASSHIRFRVLSGLIKAGFERIGIGSTFIHAGSAIRNPAGVTWLY